MSTEPTTEAGKGFDHYTEHKSFCAFRAALDGPCTCGLTGSLVNIENEAREQGAREERERLRRKHSQHVQHDVAPTLVRNYGDWLLAVDCPVRSSITGAMCRLNEGHAPYRADRFHRYLDEPTDAP